MAKNKNLSGQFGTSEYFQAVADGHQPPAMFATAKELWDHTEPGDFDAPYSQVNSQGEKEDAWHDTKEDLYNHKLTNKPAVTESIKKDGYDWAKHNKADTHVTIQDDILLDGHHRVVAMHKYRPDEFIPIRTLQ